jgi:beta-glucanase (GH16 family)
MLKLVLLLAMAAPLSAQTWNLQWSDEFNGESGAAPNDANWRYDTGNHNGFGNGEIEYYCAPESNDAPCSAERPNIFLDGSGHLVIKATRTNGQWTSGRLLTSGKQSFQYGRIEARMKMDAGDGFWPAFWMLGDTLDKVGWPRAGEQDIMEWVQKYTASTTSSTVHGPGYSGGKGIGSQFTFPNGGRIDDPGFHVYGVVWSEDRMEFYRDNPAQPYFVMTPSKIPDGAAWVYNQPFFLLLNFAIGSGGFPGKTDDTTPDSGTALVDYVRVYKAVNMITAGSAYVVTNKQNGTCIAGIREAKDRGTVVQQPNCGAAANNQQWQFTATGEGFYRVSNRDEQTAWETVKNVVLLRELSKSRAQEWKPSSNSDGTLRFLSRKGDSCLTASGSRTVPLREAACNGSGEQSWTLTQIP